MSSKSFGADPLASRASRQAAGELVAACDTDATGAIERAARDCVRDSRVAMVAGGEEEANDRDWERSGGMKPTGLSLRLFAAYRGVIRW